MFFLTKFSWRLITFTVLLLAFTSVFLFTGCDKESITQVEPMLETVETRNELRVPELLADKDDPENDKVNKVLYVFAHAVKDLSTDSEILALLKDEMKKDKKGYGLSLRQLAVENERFGVQLASKLEKYLGEPHLAELKTEMQGKTGHALTKQLSAALLCRGKVYEPVVHTLRQETELSFRSQDVVVAIAQEMNDNDEVLAYRNGSSTPFLLSEAAALASNDLIIFVGPGDITYELEEDDIQGESLFGLVEFGSNLKLERFRMQIKNGFHFEDDNTSEIRGWYVISHLDDNSILVQRQLDFDNVSRSNINRSTLFREIQLLGIYNTSSLYTSHKSFIGAYEYDWYASKKTITNDCAPYNAKVKMKFSHEFYFKTCGITFLGELLPPNFSAGNEFENEKCRFGFRVRY